MYKKMSPLLALLILFAGSAHAYGEDPGFFEKRFHNPAWIYRYKTSQDKIIAIDVRQLLALLSIPGIGVNEQTPSNDPRYIYNLITMPFGLTASLWMLYQDFKGCIGEFVFNAPVMGILHAMNVDPHVKVALMYGARALYTEKILPWSYEGEDQEEEALELAE